MPVQGFDWLDGAICVWTALPDATHEPLLHADEAALVADMAVRRRTHFAAGRTCAHAALARLGVECGPLLRDANGAPAWPAGVSGSLSHCPEAAVAIVARRDAWPALGIDVEADRPLPDDAAGYVLTEPELAALARLPGGAARWALAAFAAKECVHKCVHPLRGAFLDFTEVAIRIDPAAGGDDGNAGFVAEALSARAHAAFAGLRWQGRLCRRDGLLFSLLAGR